MTRDFSPLIKLVLLALKQSQNKKGRKFVSAEKKTPFLVQLKQIFGPSYFDRALVYDWNFRS